MAIINLQKVVVFGGSFSPPTLAHVEIIERCLALPDADEVWLVPSSNRTDKHIAASPKDQLAMLEILVKTTFHGNKHLRVIDTELRRGIETETYDTYTEFLQQYPAFEFWFVFGTDSYRTIEDWLNGDWLANNLPVLLVERNGFSLPPSNNHVRHLASLSKEVAPVSSTNVRLATKRGKPILALVPQEIADYIQANRLFL